MTPSTKMQRVTKLATFFLLGVAACAGPQTTVGLYQVEIVADGQTRQASVPAGSSVSDALDAAGIETGPLDRVAPPAYTILTDGTQIVVRRVSEQFEVETRVVPFQRQTLRNESLPLGETRLLQPGSNGLEEVTVRIVQEEGVEISRQTVKSVVVQEPVPEIVMVGAQSVYVPLPIEGTLVYLSAGNVWLLRSDTGNRRPLIVTGDLDGRILRLSPDGRWLLFSRRDEDDDPTINSLWIVSTVQPQASPLPLAVNNVIHFADWSPIPPSDTVSQYQIAYSTVEPSPSPPGWQANNDLAEITLSLFGSIIREQILVEANAGGQYGWWGTHFAWRPDGQGLAFARPDGVGFIDPGRPQFTVRYEVVPYQAPGDWAWVPGLAWGQDNRTAFTVEHGAPIGLEAPSASPVFNVVALVSYGGRAYPLAERTGMFAAPSVSPLLDRPGEELAYRVAYLQAMSPLESDTSGYRVVVMDRDGSNQRTVFPPEGEAGVEPQQVVWSPSGEQIAVLQRGDLYLVDLNVDKAQRITGEGQILAFDWKP